MSAERSEIDSSELLKDKVPFGGVELPLNTPKVRGYDWKNGVNYEKLFESYLTTGFQATNFARAVNEINNMLDCREIPLSLDKLDLDETDEFIRVKSNCTVFLGYTSNMVSSGVRETIKYLVQNKFVDCIVVTAGGVEEDFMKCMAPTHLGAFDLRGKILREQNVHRIGNLVLTNNNYVVFEKWLMPLLDEILEDQKLYNILWTPSKIIQRIGERINNEDSIYYWAAKNKIPVFSPALTDGAFGDALYTHSLKNPGLVVDILADARRLNTIALKAVNSGMVIVGGGLIKHHICNANSWRNGADYTVYINTSTDFDGSDSGARPDEAISWGKIKIDSTPVKIYAEATLVFPLLVSQTFAKRRPHLNGNSNGNLHRQ